MNEKTCSKCKKTFPATREFFHKKRNYELGSRCKICRKKDKIYYLRNKEKRNQQSKEWYKKNKDKMRENFKSRYHSKLKHSATHKIRNNLSRRIRHALHTGSKSSTTLEFLGCTIEYFKIHLESQFSEGMTFENYGEWHIDHIMPCASFNLIEPEEQKKCFHYSNLQPLWAEDNLRKGNKIL